MEPSYIKCLNGCESGNQYHYTIKDRTVTCPQSTRRGKRFLTKYVDFSWILRSLRYPQTHFISQTTSASGKPLVNAEVRTFISNQRMDMKTDFLKAGPSQQPPYYCIVI